MSFLGIDLSRKPGGTTFGNIFRSVASALTDGKLGNGSLMISQQEYDYKRLSDADYARRYGMDKTGRVLGAPDLTFRTPAEYAAGAFPTPNFVAPVVSGTLEKYVPWLVGGFILFLGVIGISVAVKK